MDAADAGASSITVAVRVRPFTIREAAQLQRSDDNTLFLGDGSLAGAPTPKLKQFGLRSVIKVVDDRCLVFDPPEDNPVQKFSRSVVPNGKKVKDQVFAFDRIFDENVSQTEVYEATTKPLLDSVLDGYNATVFAYGATGCGKTHTITGTAQMPGIIFLTMQELFEKIADRSDEKHTEISLSYLEIYNETIRDLLVSGGSKQGLMLREDSNQAVTVANLTSHHPKDVQEVMDMIIKGNEYRTVSPTEANAVSSRSHAVLQINVAQKDRNASVNEPHTMATLSIIDLAGSERASATKNRGERLLEGANINKSLLALGSCINALCDPRKTNHVPYRNSKLTRLLKFSLGGNCKTVMIVCVSPSSAHFDETQNTLRYANRAKNIQTKVTRNVFNVNRHVKDFLVKIDEQIALINELKAQQKDAERIFFAKFQKQSERREAASREGIQRLRTAYENSAMERQEKVNNMKKLRSVERRIDILSAWIASFDEVRDKRKRERESEECMPSNLTAMRKTAKGILLELENSRHHIHQKLNKTNWERAIDSALQHSINQLPSGDGCVDSGEIANLTREAAILKSDFGRDACREVLDQDKTGDANMIRALLTAQFEMTASLAQTMTMDEDEAVTHAKTIITRLLDTAMNAAAQVVKPADGTSGTSGANGSFAKMSSSAMADHKFGAVEKFAPSRRGTPKRKKLSSVMLIDGAKPIPNPALAAVTAASCAVPSIDPSDHASSSLFLSPIKGSPRRRKVLNATHKGVSFTPVKKKSPSKRMVRWRDDDGESGALADFEKTPTKEYDSTPEPLPSTAGTPGKAVPPSPLPSVTLAPPAPPAFLNPPVSGLGDADNSYNHDNDEEDDSLVLPPVSSASGMAAATTTVPPASSSSLVLPETASIPPAKVNRFQAGFLSKSRPSSALLPHSPAPAPSLTHKFSFDAHNTSSYSDDEHTLPLRNLDLARSSNMGPHHTRRTSSLSPRPSIPVATSTLPRSKPATYTSPSSNSFIADENQPPHHHHHHNSSDSDEPSSLINTSGLRSALHASKRRDRYSMLSAGTAGPALGNNARRISSFGALGNGNGSGVGVGGSRVPGQALASSTNGISRLRRGSAERRRSPPISCSPPDMGLGSVKGFTVGQARRMGLGRSSLALGAMGGSSSPGDHTVTGNVNVGNLSFDAGRLGGVGSAGGSAGGGGGMKRMTINVGPPGVDNKRGSVVWR